MKLYLNGKKIESADATLSIFDLGFTMGVSVTEQIRTFARKTPLLDRHLDRFFGGLKIIGLEIPFQRSEIKQQIDDLIADNGKGLKPKDELGIGVCATPGIASRYGQSNRGPTVMVYTYPLHANELKEAVSKGVRLTSVTTQEVPTESIPKTLKCRSRMHYYLAEKEAQAMDPDSRAVLNDSDGFVAEGTTASVAMIQSGKFVAPSKETILSSVTLGYVIELAEELGIPVERRNISPQELESADEVLWLTTPTGITPVTHVNKKAINNGSAGEITKALATAWIENLNGRLG